MAQSTQISDRLKSLIEPIDLDQPDISSLAERVKDAKVLLLGESTHGTKEFYDLRAKISMELIRKHGFNLVCLEADWPDAEDINSYIHERAHTWKGFERFPTWMWRNKSFSRFIDELRFHNALEQNPKASIYGLDLYSLSRSLDAVFEFFKKRDPVATERILRAKECLDPWRFDPSQYGLAVWHGLIEGCENQVLALLKDVHERHLAESETPNQELLSVLQNSRVLKSAEEYYRIMYRDSIESWNIRDRHMFETLLILLQFHGPDSKAIVWEHNSHIGNARATQMGQEGELNIGQLCKDAFKTDAYSIGFLTNRGTVAAASHWGSPMEIKELRSVRDDSYEFILHKVGVSPFLLPLKNLPREILDDLAEPRLERAVGVLYLPSSERISHYFRTSLPSQFDEICWIDETNAVVPLPGKRAAEPDTYPFGL